MKVEIDKVNAVVRFVNAYIDLVSDVELTDEKLTEYIDYAISVSKVSVTPLELDEVKRDLTYQHQIRCTPGQSLLDDYDDVTWYTDIKDPIRVGMGDKKAGSKVIRIDGYSFDEVDHSLILLISDFQDSFSTENLTMTRVDELYWRLYNFLDEVCNGNIEKYFDDSDDILKISRLIRKRMKAAGDDPDMLLKIKFFIITNKELSTALLNTNLLETTIRKTKGRAKTTKTTKKIKKADFNDKPLEINLWHLERFFEMENSNNNDPIVIDVKNDFPELGFNGIPCIKGNIGDNLGYEAYIAIIPGKLLASIYIEHGSKVLEGNVRAFLGTNGSKSVNSGIKRTINNDPTATVKEK